MDEQVVTVILGAGASRAVSYSGDYLPPKERPLIPSPLDKDFFELLQRFEAETQDVKIKAAMGNIIRSAFEWKGEPIWQSMEKMFYSLHVSAMLNYLLIAPGERDLGRDLVNDFLRSIQALLNEAHGTRTCSNHVNLLQRLDARDAVVTFNYDFVAERALAQLHGLISDNKAFGDWFYGFTARSSKAPNDVPTLYKLHGSLNWKLEEDNKGEVQTARKEWPKTWAEFGNELEYLPKDFRGYGANERQRPPILLPYWDKRVEKGVWLNIWKAAADHLRRTHSLIVWGYSLPITDLKARELLRLACFSSESNLTKVAVIDPSRDTRDRWRSMFAKEQFWGFSNYEEFRLVLSRYNNILGPFRTP